MQEYMVVYLRNDSYSQARYVTHAYDIQEAADNARLMLNHECPEGYEITKIERQ